MAQPPATQFSGIFVSYRRDDSSGHAGRLFDNLAKHFGPDQIFMDIDTIEPGEDFVTVIENAVGSCEILIVMIGRHWLSNAGETTRRLDNPNDFVRLEITTALNRGIRVIPVLVQRSSMPRPQDLPPDLAKFTRRNAVELSDLRWPSDVDRLIHKMEGILAQRQEAKRLAEADEKARQLIEAKEKQRSELEAYGGFPAEEKRRDRDEAKRKEDEERQKRELEAGTQSQSVASRSGLVGLLGVKRPIWIGTVVLLLIVSGLVMFGLAVRNKRVDERSGTAAVTSSPTPAESPTPSASPATSPTPPPNTADNTNTTRVTKRTDSETDAQRRKAAREAEVRQKCARWLLDNDGPCPFK